MTRPTAKEILDAYEPLNGQPADLRVSQSLSQELAKGKPVSVERAAQITGLSPDIIRQSFDHARKMGAEFNEKGELVGQTLTLNPTPYHFRVNGQQMYTWCALDSILMPGIIDATAEVESTCYVTGDQIRLTVTPDGVSEYFPKTTVLSIFVPGSSPQETVDGSPAAGPQSAVCSQMRFFRSRDVAEIALENFENIGILSVEQAYQLARKVWIAPISTGITCWIGKSIDHA